MIDNPLSSGPLEFEKHTYNALGVPPLPRITNVLWVRLKSENGLDCIVSDMQHGKLFLWEFDQPDVGLVPIADVAHPSHVEVSDLNQDGQFGFADFIEFAGAFGQGARKVGVKASR